MMMMMIIIIIIIIIIPLLLSKVLGRITNYATVTCRNT
jgi:hypothetical protein